MTPVRTIALALLLAACGPKLPNTAMLEAPPKLPAPRGSTYVSVEGEPGDPAIAKLAKGKAWNETLSGAAAGLALEWSDGSGDLAGWEVREAAWQAGWAWPILEVRGWMTRQAEEPPGELVDWLKTLDADQPLGLVRARGRQGDAWVALRGQPRGDIGTKPRQVPLDYELRFDAQPGVSLTVADSVGVVRKMTLDAERAIRVDAAGEWLFEFRDDDGLIALFPIYAAMVPPETKVLSRQSGRVESAADAANGFVEILAEVREIYGLPGYEDDPLIQAAAASFASGRTASSVAAVAKNLGYDPDRTWKITCRARTLTDCADQILWNPRARPALFTPRADLGLAAELVGDGVTVVVLVAAH